MQIEFEIKNKWFNKDLFIQHCQEVAVDEDFGCEAEVRVEDNKVYFITFWSGFQYYINLNGLDVYNHIKVTYTGARKGFLNQSLLFDCEDVNILRFTATAGSGTNLSHYDSIVVPIVLAAKAKFEAMGFNRSTVNNLVKELDYKALKQLLCLEEISISGWISTGCTSQEYHGLSLKDKADVIRKYQEAEKIEKDRQKRVELFTQLKSDLVAS